MRERTRDGRQIFLNRDQGAGEAAAFPAWLQLVVQKTVQGFEAQLSAIGGSNRLRFKFPREQDLVHSNADKRPAESPAE